METTILSYSFDPAAFTGDGIVFQFIPALKNQL